MTRSDIGLISLTAFALIFSFPPFLGGPIAMAALIPFFYFIGKKSSWQAFFGGYVIGFIWTLGTLYWIGWATITGLIGSVIYVPLFLAVFALILYWLFRFWGRKALWLTPSIWTGMEIVQASGVMGFPWNQLANSQAHFTPFIQFASVFGSYAISFWIVLINVLLFWLIQFFGKNRRTYLLMASIALLFLIPWLHGNIVFAKHGTSKSTLNVSLVQGNINPFKKWTPAFVDSNMIIYDQLSYEARNKNPNLIVWPETATPCYLRYRFHYLSQVKAIADSLDASILTGSPDYEWNQKGEAIVYNAALLIQPNCSQIQRYFKNHPVPFSERVPLVDKLPFFYQWLENINLDVGNYAAGDSTYVFHVDCANKLPYRFGTAICFDSVFPSHVRQLVKKGAQLLVVITNDGWFGHTSGPYQHAQIAVMRAIETRRWIVRCANTGISGFIDPWGRYCQKSAFGEKATLHQTITLRNDETFYVRYGAYLQGFILLCNLFIFLCTYVKQKKY